MALVPAICTQCGAQIEVDDTHEAGICKHCGTAFITEKVINKYTVINNNNFDGANINMINPVNMDAIINCARAELLARNIDGATKYLDEIINNCDDAPTIIFELFREVKILDWLKEIIRNKPLALKITVAIEKYDTIDLELYIEMMKLSIWAADIKRYGNHVLSLAGDRKDEYEHKVYWTFVQKEFDGQRAVSTEHVLDGIPNEYIEQHRDIQDYIIEEYKRYVSKYPFDESAFTRIVHEKIPPDRLLEVSIIPKTGACYIATCVYGSYDCPQVWTLRRFRDHTLDNTWYGRAFIKCYYTISPALVKWLGQTKWFRAFWKHYLDKVVYTLNQEGIEDTQYIDKY